MGPTTTVGGAVVRVVFVVFVFSGVVRLLAVRGVHLEQVQLFVYCVVFFSVVHVRWTHFLQLLQKTDPLVALLCVIRFEHVGQM